MARFQPACERIRGNLWRYIDRELSAPDLAEISAHLKACGDCSRVFEARACDAKIYRMAFVDSPFGEAFVERFRNRFDGEPVPAAGTSPGVRTFPGTVLSNPRRLIARVALLSALLAIGASVLFGLRPDASLGSVTARGSPAMFRGTRDLRPGDRFSLREGDEVRVLLKDGSELDLEGPAGFRVDEESRADGRFAAHLTEGTLLATVAHREEGREMLIFSPDASARVVGTRFTLRVERRHGTTLEVEEGEVLFRSHGGREVAVNPRTGPSFAPSGMEPEVPLARSSGETGEAEAPKPSEETGPAQVPAEEPVLDHPEEVKPAPDVPPLDVPKDVDLPVSR